MRAVEKTDSAFEAIERLILNGSTPPGAPLRVAALSKALNVSATPVREALARLEEKRLAVPGANCGWRVAPVSLAELEDLEDARLSIEERLLEDSISHGGIDWESNLIAAHHRLMRTPQPIGFEHVEDGELWAVAHDGFHKGLLAAGQSSWLKSFHDTTLLQLHRHHQALLFHPRVINPDGPDRHSSETLEALQRALAPEHHGLLMQAALDRDEKAAKHLLREHVEIALASYKSVLE
jgi:DNA-binding GntR family transcriptional regulator